QSHTHNTITPTHTVTHTHSHPHPHSHTHTVTHTQSPTHTHTYHKEHLLLVRQQEEAEHGGVRDLIIKRLSVQVQERRVDTDIIPVGRRELVRVCVCGCGWVCVCVCVCVCECVHEVCVCAYYSFYCFLSLGRSLTWCVRVFPIGVPHCIL